MLWRDEDRDEMERGQGAGSQYRSASACFESNGIEYNTVQDIMTAVVECLRGHEQPCQEEVMAKG